MWKQTDRLLGVIFRQERFRMLLWLIGLVGITIMTLVSYQDLYSKQTERDMVAETMDNPALIAIMGKSEGLTDYTIGAMFSQQMLLFTALAIGVMAILFVAKHARGDEESGILELVRSLPVGRLSHLTATLIAEGMMLLILVLAFGFGIGFFQASGIDWQGAFLFAVSLGGIGLFFVGVASCCAQLSSSKRGATGLAFAVLLSFYILRALAVVTEEKWTWVSPFGWIENSQPFVHNDWWPIILLIVTGLLLIGLSFYLHVRRDYGAGLLKERSGKREASPLFGSIFALFVKTQRTSLIAWTIGLFLFGAMYGAVLDDLDTYVKDNEMLEQMIMAHSDYTLVEQFIGMLILILAIVAIIPAILALLRVKNEEMKGRLELLYSLPISRLRLMSNGLGFGMLVGVWMLAVSVAGLLLSGNIMLDETLSIKVYAGAAAVYIPALILFLGLVSACMGLVPRLTGISWVYLAFSYLVTYMGELLQLPKALQKLSIFEYIPELPVEDVKMFTLLVVTIIAVVLLIIGFVTYRRRDIQSH